MSHLDPDGCYVCGGEEHPQAEGGHLFWSNAMAAAHFRAEAAKHDRPGLIEARYVAQHRPY